MSRLIDTAGIAEILGRSQRHVTARITKRPDFPKPRIDVNRRLRKWAEADVLKWAQG